ncbi:uncharacterized protein B0H18DRAFT_216778 [Fomitopsis serialis]|uniref:uncharacterized protein n=1 Tax=Fomitopsis serialis TaxID=139415 RepID=UPI0020072152|nr:uncharacterized protein B0H18DRAFT_216778 [Neoantrodia serialis]KAH9913105.1 hypothetical protein B0H18DRAFT_216778 [Neoantrodia serialis]
MAMFAQSPTNLPAARRWQSLCKSTYSPRGEFLSRLRRCCLPIASSQMPWRCPTVVLHRPHFSRCRLTSRECMSFAVQASNLKILSAQRATVTWTGACRKLRHSIEVARSSYSSGTSIKLRAGPSHPTDQAQRTEKAKVINGVHRASLFMSRVSANECTYVMQHASIIAGTYSICRLMILDVLSMGVLFSERGRRVSPSRHRSARTPPYIVDPSSKAYSSAFGVQHDGQDCVYRQRCLFDTYVALTSIRISYSPYSVR